MRCIFTNRTIGMTSFSIGTNRTIGTLMETLLITTNTSGVYLWVLDNPQLNEKKFVLNAMAFERAVERDYFIFSANISEYGIAVIN